MRSGTVDFEKEFPYIGYTRPTKTTMDQTKILYVDDDTALRAIVKDQLTAQGYVVDEAEDGVEAIDMIEKGNYDLMLLDINMPNKSGIDVLKLIKDRSMKCKVIMVTGRVGFSVATESLKLGADDYITKPFNLEYLLFSIRRVLSK
jgi:DNA-binding response OmpR family regulator